MYEHHREREGIPEHHELAKELLAGFVAAEIDKHFEQGRYGHLNRREARRLAGEQAASSGSSSTAAATDDHGRAQEAPCGSGPGSAPATAAASLGK